MYYSVPYTYLRKKAEIEATSCAVAIFIDGVRVATHARLWGHPGQYSTNPEHMPDTHRDYAEWNGDRFRRWAAEKGPSIAKVVDGLLCSRTIEQQAYRSCRALLELGRRQGYDVLEKACAIYPAKYLRAWTNINIISNFWSFSNFIGMHTNIDSTMNCAIRTNASMTTNNNTPIVGNAKTWTANV